MDASWIICGVSYLVFATIFYLWGSLDKFNPLKYLGILFFARGVVTLSCICIGESEVALSWTQSGFRIAIGLVLVYLIIEAIIKYNNSRLNNE